MSPEAQALRDIEQRLYDIMRSAPVMAMNNVPHPIVMAVIDFADVVLSDVQAIMHAHGLSTRSGDELEEGGISDEADTALREEQRAP